MIKGINKIPILRYGLITILIFILCSGSFYLYLHYSRAQKLQDNISRLITSRENSAMIDSCLLNLYNADNNSRLYAVTGDKTYLRCFSAQINAVSNILDDIKFRHRSIAAFSADKLKLLIGEKKTKTNSYMQLRQITDSLIRTTLRIDSTLAYSRVKIPLQATKTVKRTVHVDTIKKVALASPPAKKKKFLGRLFSVFSGKKHPDTALVLKTDTVIQTEVKAKTIYAHIPAKTRNYYRRLYMANTSLKNNEHSILLINNSLLSQMIAALKQYKVAELAYAEESKNELAGNVTDVFTEYNILSRLTIGALILLILTLFYNIWKIFLNQRQIIDYGEKAEQYADAKSKFMANMSHEIRTPLNSVIGFSEQLGMGKLSAAQAEQVGAIRSSSQMLLDVVNEILDFSKYETGRMNFENQPFMPQQALDDVFSSVTIQAARKNIQLKKEIQIGADVWLGGDVLRLKQVVMNLLVNALKFTSNGEVLLQAMLMPAADARETKLRVRVKDTGIGISRQNLPTIFEEFAQVTEAQKVTHHKGTGLGLAICKKIVELQGGTIRVMSEPGKGSVFSFELPFAISEANPCDNQEQLSREELAELVKNKSVLLAEDNQLNVLLAKTILKKWNICCDVALNGNQALTLFENNNYDLVLTDIQMPEMDGMELTELIRKHHNYLKAETPIIAFTANVLKEDRDNYLQAGINDIVLKPFVEHTLIETIANTMRIRQEPAAGILFRYG